MNPSYINKQCDNLENNVKNMINSCIDRKRKKITLDRILVKKNNNSKLIN